MKDNKKTAAIITVVFVIGLFFLSRLVESESVRMDILIPLIYILIGFTAGSLANTLFESRLKKSYVLLDGIVGTVGAFIFGIYESFARDEVRFSNYIVATIGAIIAVSVSKGVRKSLKKNRVERYDKDGNVIRNTSIFNRGFLAAVLAWILNSFTIGIIILVRSNDIFLELFEGNIILEYLRISLTNLAYEAVLWLPVIIIAGGIRRKKGFDASFRFVFKAFIIYLIVWGGLMWYITGA
jgi:uncharacterized membrane protein YeaQ/YmgE (transglycosylase-associated protein family)